MSMHTLPPMMPALWSDCPWGWSQCLSQGVFQLIKDYRGDKACRSCFRQAR